MDEDIKGKRYKIKVMPINLEMTTKLGRQLDDRLHTQTVTGRNNGKTQLKEKREM